MADLNSMTGFGNTFATEARPGGLPAGQNAPQKYPLGLYTEQLSGSSFTMPRDRNKRTWTYRIRPSVMHEPYTPYETQPLLRSGPFDEVPTPPNQMRWGPAPMPTAPTDFIDGLTTIGGSGTPGEAVVIPRGIKLRVDPRATSARLHLREPRRALPPARPRPHRRQRPLQPPRLPHARCDLQSWESQPLGPFLGKIFATSFGPWIIPAAALEPYRIAMPTRDPSLPQPLPYLTEAPDARCALDITLEVWLTTPRMRAERQSPFLLSRGSAQTLNWSFAQMIAHHTSNRCNLRTGDLLASGTLSGPEAGSEGCLLEKTRRGADPVRLPSGELRSFLEDGDEVILKACCERSGLPRISFGECRGTILPARC